VAGLALTRFREAAGRATSAFRLQSPAIFPDFQFPDQRGLFLNKTALSGHVWIADFIFTTCTSACPLLTSRLVTVQRRLSDERLRFVSFSVDPERDTESELARYAARWAQQESRWHLLRTDAQGLSSVLAGLHVGLERVDGELAHTRRIFLVDAWGNLAGDFDSGDDAALEALVNRTLQLLGAHGASSPIGGRAAELFGSLGCAGCHDDPQLAPPLGGLAGHHVMLERSGSVLADDDYLRRYPNSVTARNGRNQAAKALDAAKSKTSVTAKASVPKKTPAKEPPPPSRFKRFINKITGKKK
jgi:protein SCO1/2